MDKYEIDNILEEVIKRERELLRIRKKYEMKHDIGIEGNLRIVDNKDKDFVQYYHVVDKNNKTGIYLGKDSIDKARALAQRSYDEELLKKIDEELKILTMIKKKYHPEEIPQIIQNMNKNRKVLIKDKILSNEDFVKEWEAYVYEGKGFDITDTSEHYTDKKERVRSKSEILIANALNRNGIPYRYECPTIIEGVNYIFHPDFTCLNVRKRKEVVWEHLGRMGDEGYAKNSIQKIDKFLNSGYRYGDNYILTMETSEKQISSRSIEMIIEKYLK